MSFGPDQTPQFSLLLCIKKGIIFNETPWFLVLCLCAVNEHKQKEIFTSIGERCTIPHFTSQL